jgi:hypothetical protein
MNPVSTETKQFTDAKFMSAAEKHRVLKAWVRFARSGFEQRWFTQALYHHLIQHCSFIAHFNRGGFYDTYFAEPAATQQFLDQFDRAKGCQSVEYGGTHWLGSPGSDYHDLNSAMVDAIQGLLPGLRSGLTTKELASAQTRLQDSQREVDRLVASQGGGV